MSGLIRLSDSVPIPAKLFFGRRKALHLTCLPICVVDLLIEVNHAS
jgi:hypothetical protein